MRLAIADDEHYVRAGILSMVEELFSDVRVVGEAATGPELVEVCRRERPDAAIVDIKMPGCDGIAAIAEVGATDPPIEWIILTSYAEFDYAKRALQVGAIGYLLKPVAPEELREVLEKAHRTVAERRNARAAHFAESVRAVLRGEAGANELAPRMVAGGLFLFDGPDEAAKPQEREPRRRALAEELDRRVEAAVGGCAHAVATTAEGHLASVVELGDAHGSDTHRSDAHRSETRRGYDAAVRRTVAASPSPNRAAGSATQGGAVASAMPADSSTSGASGGAAAHAVPAGAAASAVPADVQFVSFPEELPLSRLGDTVKELEEALPVRFMWGEAQWIDGAALLKEHRRLRRGVREAFEQLDALCAAVRAGNIVVALTTVEILASNQELPQLLSEPRTQRGVARALRLCGGYEGPVHTARRFLADVTEHLRERLQAGGGQRDRTAFLVDATLEYVSMNFHRDIGIAEIAEHVGVTPNYLSSVIHARTGKTFGEQLRGYRLDRARQLLLEEPHSVSAVAAKVGYHDAKHFSKLFLRRFGCTPQDFRRSGCRERV